jgi:hypothetical protein
MMAAIITNEAWNSESLRAAGVHNPHRTAARTAVDYADALLAELDKEAK